MSSLENRLLSHFSHKTPWTFTSSSGLSLGAAIAGLSGGTLYLKNGSSGQEDKLHYFGAGLSVGPLPFSFSYSTASMWSTGVGSIMAASDSLSYDDMKGPMCVLSGTFAAGLTPGIGGISGSLYFLGFPVGMILLSGAVEILVSGLLTARAFGIMAGHVHGADAGLSLQPGYAH